MRLFVAIELSTVLRERVRELQQQLRPLARGIKWVAPENLHLTVKFLGDVTEAHVAAVGAALERCTAATKYFGLEFKGLGAFPNLRSPRVIWVGVSGGLAALQALVEGAEQGLEPLGFAPERRPFSAHLTLGRARHPGPDPSLQRAMEGLKEVAVGALTVSSLALMESKLGGADPVYTQVSRHPLKTG